MPGRRPAPVLRVVVRRATAADTDAVSEFTRTTWDGWDYLPDVWGTWLTARDGLLLVAEAADDQPLADIPPGRPIAVGRLVRLSATEGWMEGLRVDPRVRGRGVATAFQLATLGWARAQGFVVVRYATGGRNVASLALGAKHGFVEAGRWRAIRPSDGGVAVARRARRRATILRRLEEAGIRPVEPASRPWARVSSDATFRSGGGLYEWRPWAWQELGAELFDRHVGAGDVLTVAGGDGSGALGMLGHERVPGENRLVLLSGDGPSALVLVEATARAAGRRPIVRLPDGSPLLDDLAPRLVEAGWRVGESSLVLLERRLHEGRVALPLPEEGRERVEFAEQPRDLELVVASEELPRRRS